MKVKFNKLTESKLPKSDISVDDMKSKITAYQFEDIPIDYKGEYFRVSGEYETDEDDIYVIYIEADDKELDLSDSEWHKIKDVVIQKIVELGRATNKKYK
jgi:hypothetical protein